MNKRAFVINPIGVEGSQIREHADDVYEFIIHPAVERFSIDAFRSDHLHEPGRISDQMFRELSSADLCFAILTGHNANVYYELALAQAAECPVIILIEKGEQLPFDTQGLRCVEYDLKPRSLSDGVYAEQIVKHLQSLERANWTVPSPFGQHAEIFYRATAQEEKVRIFEGPKQDKYNVEFYEYFRERLLNARDDVYITGDGFECADEQGRRLAAEFIQAFRVALTNGAAVVRVQTRARSNVEWAEMLAALKREFPERFSLFVLTDEIDRQVSNVCVIDPESPDQNVVEIMLTTERLFGVQAADLAGTALFVSQSQEFARDLRQRILALTDPRVSVSPRDPDEIVTLLSGTEYYFAYGSNMSPSQMQDRCPSAAMVGVGVLRGYCLVFNRRGTYRAGGVAGIAESDGERVYGIIWQLNPREFDSLDRAEDASAYTRVSCTVTLLDAKEFDCHIYEAIPQGEFAPDPEYLEILINAASEVALPDDYVEMLKSYRTKAAKGG